MKLQPIFNLAKICAARGVTKAILSPGSRCAPLTLAFSRHPHIDCKSISDERAAAFIGLGVAQQLDQPVVLSCTSGSAAYNYSPAIAEAYFQHVPLIILTADRPAEWIDQLDGQTIRQHNIYGQHVKKSFSMPVDLSHQDAEWHAYRIMSEALNLSQEFPKGPVHINLPFREPFYPESDENPDFNADIKIVEQHPPNKYDIDIGHFQKEWQTYSSKLIVCGQQTPDKDLTELLIKLATQHRIPVIGDIISNQHTTSDVIAHHDLFLADDSKGLWASLKPDLLITLGRSTISKNLKLFLRAEKPVQNWHIQPHGDVADTYQSLTKVVRSTPKTFFEQLINNTDRKAFDQQKQENYYHIWQIEERKTKRAITSFFEQNDQLNELMAVESALSNLPPSANLHLANSMAVRYANFIGLSKDHVNIQVFANRGTSGIDGSNSTAVGATLVSGKLNILITGDMAFFYDRNAFWHNYDLHNLRIILLNNHGGGIFRMIKGPKDLPEYKEFFETDQRLSAKHLAAENGFEYLKCDKKSKLKNYVTRLFESSDKAIILEVETTSEQNVNTISSLKEIIKGIH